MFPGLGCTDMVPVLCEWKLAGTKAGHVGRGGSTNLMKPRGVMLTVCYGLLGLETSVLVLSQICLGGGGFTKGGRMHGINKIVCVDTMLVPIYGQVFMLEVG